MSEDPLLGKNILYETNCSYILHSLWSEGGEDTLILLQYALLP